MTRILRVVHAGSVPYRDALRWQRALAAARIDGRLPDDTLLLLEHPAVLTLGRAARPEHVVDARGIEVIEVERGGDVTYHGPGQLVGYPILALSQHRRDLHWYLRALEQALIDALGVLGVVATRRPGCTGVWTSGRKIASLGVHVKQWVTWHGFALNVTTELREFERIVPCGLAGVDMTSVARELPAGAETSAPTLGQRAACAIVGGFESVFDLDARDETLDGLVASGSCGPNGEGNAHGREAAA